MSRMSQMVRFFTIVEQTQIIDEIIQSQELGRKEIFPEDICTKYADREVMPWHLLNIFKNHGKLKYFKYRHYGHNRIEWSNLHMKAKLWKRYWDEQINDWEIAKEFGTSWQVIRRQRSKFHHADNDPRWVKYIHTVRKGVVSTQEKLVHTTAQFLPKEGSKQLDFFEGKFISEEVHNIVKEECKNLQNAYSAMEQKYNELKKEYKELDSPKQTLKVVTVDKLCEVPCSINEIKAALMFIPILDLLRMVHDNSYHVCLNVMLENGKADCYVRLKSLDPWRMVAHFYISYFIIEESSK